MTRPAAFYLLSISIGMLGTAHAAAGGTCKPKLTIANVNFSEMQKTILGRKWTATVAVDASGCAALSGKFVIGFERLKENAPDDEFREQFDWVKPSVDITLEFWADEAVAHYWIDEIAPCPCVP